MRMPSVAFIGAALLLQPFAAGGQPFGDVVGESLDRRKRQLESVDRYVKRVKGGGIPGLEARPVPGAGECSSFANCEVVEVDPQTKQERTLSPMEVSVLAGVNPGSVFFDQLGQGFFQAQEEINSRLGPLMPSLGGGLGVGMPPWLDPTQMFYIGGIMALEAATATETAQQSLNNSAELAQAQESQSAAMAGQFDPAGEEDLDGTPTLLFRADPFDMPVQQGDGEQFALSSATIWVDRENYVFVKHRFEGTAVAEGESRDFFIEVVNSDFRNPPGCGDLYEPYRRVMRMGGMLDEAEMAQMEEARAQLAEFEQQLEAMPADQRQMMERMMGSQMQMMRGLVNSGAIERVEEVEEILCNPDLASLFSLGSPDSEDNLVQQIQLNLVALGYQPGNTDGVLDTLTRVAISQFQAEQALPVTGEPSAELAALLADLVEGQ